MQRNCYTKLFSYTTVVLEEKLEVMNEQVESMAEHAKKSEDEGIHLVAMT